MWVVNLEIVTNNSTAMEECKKSEAKVILEKLNNLKSWFISFKTQLLNMELDDVDKINDSEIAKNIKKKKKKYIDNLFQTKTRSCEIYKKRIGLINIERNTLECIAEPYGITRERVRQLLLKTQRKVL